MLNIQVGTKEETEETDRHTNSRISSRTVMVNSQLKVDDGIFSTPGNWEFSAQLAPKFNSHVQSNRFRTI
ncbi:hypothetical protein [Nostoc sp.]